MVRLLVGLLGGLIVALLVGFASLKLDQTGFSLAGLVFFFVVPVGAVLLGIPAGFALSYLSWDQSKSGLVVLGVLAIGSALFGAISLFAYHSFLFSSLGYFATGSTFHGAFVDHFSQMQISSRYGDHAMDGWGLVLGYLSYVAAAVGGLAGVSGASIAPSTQKSRLAEVGKSVATLAILLGEVDGELDDDEIKCGRYTTKLGLEELAVRTFGVSKKQAAAMVDDLFQQARQELKRDLLFTEAVDRAVSAFDRSDAVLKELILFGLAAVVAVEDMDSVNREQVVLLGYIGKALGHNPANWKKTFGYGMALRQQILLGTMK